MAAAKPGREPAPPDQKGSLEPPEGLTDSQKSLWCELVMGPFVTSKDLELLHDAMRECAIRDGAYADYEKLDVPSEAQIAYRTYRDASKALLALRRALKASPQARYQASGGKLKPAVDRAKQPNDDIEIDD